MTAFLFISSSRKTLARRVDMTNFGSLFGDRDDPKKPARAKVPMARVAMTMLILLGTVGDALLVTRPDVLRTCIGAWHAGEVARKVSF